MVQIKIHKSYRDIIAVCDSDLIGEKFEEGKFQIDAKESFYKGEEVEEKKLIKILKDLMKEDATFNIIGKNSVSCALRAGIISEEGVGRIAGIPFALVLL
jgi:hypothetical protein